MSQSKATADDEAGALRYEAPALARRVYGRLRAERAHVATPTAEELGRREGGHRCAAEPVLWRRRHCGDAIRA